MKRLYRAIEILAVLKVQLAQAAFFSLIGTACVFQCLFEVFKGFVEYLIALIWRFAHSGNAAVYFIVEAIKAKS